MESRFTIGVYSDFVYLVFFVVGFDVFRSSKQGGMR